MITLYSTNCPKCKVLEAKLKQKNIEYNTITDVAEMLEHNIKSAPVLRFEDDTLMNFTDAVKWVNAQ